MGRLATAAHDALEGENGQSAPAVLEALAAIAGEIAKGLRRGESEGTCGRDPVLDGPPTTPAEDEYFALEARAFLEVLSDFLRGGEAGFEYAFNVQLTRRPDWKPRKSDSEGKRRRLAAAARVYELMAATATQHCVAPKQYLAVEQVMKETGLPRSKVMQGLKEYRERFRTGPGWWIAEAEGLKGLTMAQAHTLLALDAMRKSPPKKGE